MARIAASLRRPSESPRTAHRRSVQTQYRTRSARTQGPRTASPLIGVPIAPAPIFTGTALRRHRHGRHVVHLQVITPGISGIATVASCVYFASPSSVSSRMTESAPAKPGGATLGRLHGQQVSRSRRRSAAPLRAPSSSGIPRVDIRSNGSGTATAATSACGTRSASFTRPGTYVVVMMATTSTARRPGQWASRWPSREPGSVIFQESPNAVHGGLRRRLE